MLDSRPLPEQEYADVEAFLQQRLGENLTLDYKRGLLPTKDKDRFELCKDISALANSQGGTIIYGVDEEKPNRMPKLPPFGTPRLVGHLTRISPFTRYHHRLLYGPPVQALAFLNTHARDK